MDTHTTASESTYTEALLTRLAALHLSGASLPNAENREVSAWLLHRLFRAVLSEGYGQ